MAIEAQTMDHLHAHGYPIPAIAALFIDTFEMIPSPGPSTRIDLKGVFFSLVAPTALPTKIEPHLMALIYCQADEPGTGVFEVVFRRGLDPHSEQLARQVSPFTVEPGKFTYRLVRGSKTKRIRSVLRPLSGRSRQLDFRAADVVAA